MRADLCQMNFASPLAAGERGNRELSKRIGMGRFGTNRDTFGTRFGLGFYLVFETAFG
jgi:hypothetical protein